MIDAAGPLLFAVLIGYAYLKYYKTVGGGAKPNGLLFFGLFFVGMIFGDIITRITFPEFYGKMGDNPTQVVGLMIALILGFPVSLLMYGRTKSNRIVPFKNRLRTGDSVYCPKCSTEHDFHHDLEKCHKCSEKLFR